VPLPITFLSDYGYADDFAGVCRAVIARLAPDARVIDITHGLPRHAIRQGAVVLANALPYAPAGVHLAVVDPGVGTQRRSLAMRVAVEDRILVGPDNGLLALAMDHLGGAVEAVEITTSPLRLQNVAATFYGRDVFAPVAARLATGAALAEAGEPVDPASLIRLSLPEPRVYPDRVIAHVLYVDGFGNAALNIDHAVAASSFLRLGERVRVEAAEAGLEVPFAHTFADVAAGGGLLYEDAYGTLALAVNRGSAAERMRLGADDEVALLPAG
jgi:S-adenosylmethionine hydrolase